MKKVRLNLKRGVKSWSFVLYDSPESAYYLKDEPIMDDDVEEYRRTITMGRGEIIEAEWLGAEWVYGEDGDEPSQYKKFDKVRLGKITTLKSTASKTKYLELYSGWVMDSNIPWVVDDSRNDVRITKINANKSSRIDFSKLFLGYGEESESDEDMTETDVKWSDEQSLN